MTLIFAFQAENITGRWFHVLLIAVPIVVQVYFNSSLTYGLMKIAGVGYAVAAPGALIGTPASMSASVEPQVEAMLVEPLLLTTSLTTRMTYGNSSWAGRTGISARSARSCDCRYFSIAISLESRIGRLFHRVIGEDAHRETGPALQAATPTPAISLPICMPIRPTPT